MVQAGSRSIGFRKDVEGLRAIAVLAVVLFHLGFERLEGGFAGVDVFFVISGFLITSIIEARIGGERFSFKDFYFGRIRRLMPALLVTVFLTLAASAVLVDPADLVAIARSAIGAVLSVSNFIFYFESGYWDTASELKPLLHTWSLGVEEQFYLVWPAAVYVISRYAKRFAGLIYLAVTLLSLAASQIAVELDPSAAFYLFPFRIFEFSIGALVIYAGRSAVWRVLSRFLLVRETLFALALAGLCYCIWILDGETPFPGINALLPAGATALVILAGTADGRMKLLSPVLLGNPVAQWLGRISYSLYLVHWPVVSLYRYSEGSELTPEVQGVLSLAMLAGAAALHYGVERQFRFRQPDPVRRPPLSATGFAFAAISAGYAISMVAGHMILSDGWTWRSPTLLLSPDVIEQGKQRRFAHLGEACRIDTAGSRPDCFGIGEPVVLVFGNSHEPDAVNFLRTGTGMRDEVRLIRFGTTNDCTRTAHGPDRWTSANGDCDRRLEQLYRPEVASRIDAVAYNSLDLYSREDPFERGVLEDLKRLNPALKIVVFDPYLVFDVACPRLVNETGRMDACRDAAQFAPEPESLPQFSALRALSDHVIDRVGLLCDGADVARCEVVTPDGVPISYDRHHWSLDFAEHAGALYAARHPGWLASLLGRDGAAEEAERELTVSPASFTGTGIVEVEARADGSALFRRISDAVPLPRGMTEGAWVLLPPFFEREVAGRTVEVRAAGHADGLQTIRLVYSTNDTGNSGWQDFEVSGAFDISFRYDVPAMEAGRGDYLGIWPETGEAELTALSLRIARPAEGE